MNDEDINLGRNIAKHRKSLNMTQTELANKAGVSRQTIAMVEVGKQNMSLNAAKKIASSLGLTMDALLKNNLKRCKKCGSILDE